MKKSILSTLAIMGGCILLLSSCEKREDGLVIDNTQSSKIYTAQMPTVNESPESKTSTADGRNVIWNEGDMVSLLSGKNVNEKYQVKEGEGGKTSTTLIKVADSDSPAGSDATFATNIAYYPYGTVNYTGEDGNHSLEVTIPNTQTYAPNTFGKGALPMVAVAASTDDDILHFKNLFGLIKLQLKGSDGVDKIKSITIKGNNGEKLSGSATVSCSNTTAPTVSFAETEVYDYVKLDCAEGVAIDKENASSFWIALPPITFSNGISVTVELGDGSTETKSTTRALTIDRSKVTPMASLTVTITNRELDIPDPKFKAYLLEVADMDNDGVLTLQDAKAWNESSSEKKFDISYNFITSLKGIEYFTALTSLNYRNNQLTTLDLSKNTALKELDCYNSKKLTYLNVSNNTALETLECSFCSLTTLDLSKNTALTSLNCGNNQLTFLDVSKNTALTSLSCYSNQITILDVSKNTALTSLSCYSNQITILDLSKNTTLTKLYCNNNQLTVLDVSNNTALTSLGCNNNQFTTLDLRKNTALKILRCYSNQITNLDVSNNTALETLYCYENQLTTLDLSNNTALTSLNCSNNQLTTLDVSNTSLNNSTGSSPLKCKMSTLNTLYLKTGWKIKGINENMNEDYINADTKIEYKD